MKLDYQFFQSMSHRMEQAAGHRFQARSSTTQLSGVASVEKTVEGGRSPAKRTSESVRNAAKLNGLRLVAVFRSQRQSPSGGKDVTGPRRRAQRWGSPKGAAEASASLGAVPHAHEAAYTPTSLLCPDQGLLLC